LDLHRLPDSDDRKGLGVGESARLPVVVEDWGCVDYRIGLQRQMEYVEQVQRQERENTLVLCSHPPVVTTGRATEQADLFAWRGPVVEVSRGGRATYHGPHQVVFYPIWDLDRPSHRKARDIGGFVRDLEGVVIEALKHFGLVAVGKEGASLSSLAADSEIAGDLDLTGVWIGGRKIASVGVAVRRWVSFHGVAFNLEHDPNAFQGLRPCGFSSSVMLSLEEALGRKVSREEFIGTLLDAFVRRFPTFAFRY
jgi:lipoyl(octanoyl) transferase